VLTIAILLLCLINSCQTTHNIKVDPVVIPIPLMPDKPDSNFEDISKYKDELPELYKDLIPDGLLLSYEDGRELIKYLISLDAYEKELLLIIESLKEQEKPPE